MNREELYDFSGRNRKPQIALAEEFGLEDFAQPSGGCCFLTDESYSRKLADLWTARGRKDYELDDIMLLKVGRHIRPAQHFKVIVSREEGENNFLMGYRKQFYSIKCVSHGGPLSLVDGEPTDDDLLTAARIASRFSQGKNSDSVTVEIQDKNGVARQVDVPPMKPEEIQPAWYV